MAPSAHTHKYIELYSKIRDDILLKIYPPNTLLPTENELMEKYQAGKLTRNTASNLLTKIGVDPDEIEFYLNEADTSRKEMEAKEQEKEKEKAKAQAAAQKPAGGKQKAKKPKQAETPEDDEKDAQRAKQAKKSLGRDN